MIVDDDEYIHELVSALLKKEGFSPCEAVNGRGVFQKMDAESRDLCILDIMMPNMDGFELSYGNRGAPFSGRVD